MTRASAASEAAPSPWPTLARAAASGDAVDTDAVWPTLLVWVLAACVLAPVVGRSLRATRRHQAQLRRGNVRPDDDDEREGG
jgi:hypothetical protein